MSGLLTAISVAMSVPAVMVAISVLTVSMLVIKAWTITAKMATVTRRNTLPLFVQRQDRARIFLVSSVPK
jgi:hypothetical protein